MPLEDGVQVSMRAYGRSETGPWRKNNQDSGYFDSYLAMVADGVGGETAGDIASALLVHEFADAVHDMNVTNEVQLRAALTKANQAIRNKILEKPELAGMATTLTGLLNLGDHVLVVNIGDSRIYRIRNDEVIQVTKDDSWVQMLLDHGLITPDEVSSHPMRNMLLHTINGSPQDAYTATIQGLDIAPGDRWLITSDGLTSYLSEHRLYKILRKNLTAEETVNQLVRAAWKTTKDNITVIIADFEPDDGTLPKAGVYLGSAKYADAIRRAG